MNIASKFVALTAAAASFAFASTPQAQTVIAGENADLYGQVRSWNVYAINSASGFNGCRAVQSGPSGPMMIANGFGTWQIIVPTFQTARFGGAILSFGKVDFDAQFGFDAGFATKELTSTELGHVRSGNQVGVEIIGDPARYWSLSGSAAAILKVEECAVNSGVRPQQSTQAAPTQSQNQAPQQNQAQPQTVVANCDTVTTGPYSCIITARQPEPGYREAYQADPNGGGQPSYFFKIRSDTEADVWVMFSDQWLPAGIWEIQVADNRCSQPKPNQSAAAWETLGQDAWNFCAR